MINVNVSNFRKEMFSYLEQVTRFNQPLSVSTKNGSVVILSDDDYRGLMETLYIESIPGLKESILKSVNTPESEFRTLEIDEDLDDFIKRITKLED